jgi:hypothetical protein
MELINIATARAVWLFDIAELNPRGKTLFPELFEWLKDEYHFDAAPQTISDLDESKALAFLRGTFQIKEEIFVDVELKIFNDGLVASTCSSTHDTDAFLEDVLKSATQEFSLSYKPEMIRKKLYVSELNVRCARRIDSLNPKLSQFAARIASLIPAKPNVPYELFGLSFSPVHGVSPLVISPFRFERKNNTTPDEQRFYSTAPLHTDGHLSLLNEFESLLVGTAVTSAPVALGSGTIIS